MGSSGAAFTNTPTERISLSSPLTRTLTCSAVRLRLLPGTSIMNPAKSGFASFTLQYPLCRSDRKFLILPISVSFLFFNFLFFNYFISTLYILDCQSVHGISLITMDQLRQSLHLMPKVPLSCQGYALRSPRSGLHLLCFHIIYGYPPLS